MSGLLRPKSYDWQSSSLHVHCLEHHELKKISAEPEPAWKNAARRKGLKVWYIVKRKVTDWPEEKYGTFNSSDSYIILNADLKDGTKWVYNVHFWIGAHSTQDEYVTAAFKSAELYAYLDEEPVIHREVEGRESDLFLSYFPDGLRFEVGDTKPGFQSFDCLDAAHAVDSMKTDESCSDYRKEALQLLVDDQVPQLHRVTEENGTTTFQLLKKGQIARSDLNGNDVFIVETNRTCFVWLGQEASTAEKYNGIVYAHNLLSKTADPLRAIVVIRDGLENDEFRTLISG